MTPSRRRVSQGSTFEDSIGYSRAVAVGPWTFVAGTTGYDYSTMTISPDVAVQTGRALGNIAAALAEVDATLDDVVRVRYLLTRRDDWPPCWPVLREAFGTARPAATMIICELQEPEMLIEIEVTAYSERDPAQ